MHIYYIILYYFILYYIILYYIHYIHQQDFSYWGISGNSPTSQKFAHSPCTWNNFFSHQRLISSPLNKDLHIINQQKLKLM